jgi:hypothetical protein
MVTIDQSKVIDVYPINVLPVQIAPKGAELVDVLESLKAISLM